QGRDHAGAERPRRPAARAARCRPAFGAGGGDGGQAGGGYGRRAHRPAAKQALRGDHVALITSARSSARQLAQIDRSRNSVRPSGEEQNTQRSTGRVSTTESPWTLISSGSRSWM